MLVSCEVTYDCVESDADQSGYTGGLTKSPLLQLGMTNWNITTLKAGTGLER